MKGYMKLCEFWLEVKGMFGRRNHPYRNARISYNHMKYYFQMWKQHLAKNVSIAFSVAC